MEHTKHTIGLVKRAIAVFWYNCPKYLTKSIVALSWALVGVFQGKGVLDKMDEPDNYQGVKLVNDFNHYKLGK